MTGQFQIIPGHPDSSVIIHVPHSSRLIPDDVRSGIWLDDAALGRELSAMTDAFTDVIAERAASLAAQRPWLFVNNFSRLVVEPERFPDDRKEMSTADTGAVRTHTSDGFMLRNDSVDEISGLVDRFFAPYASAFSDLVDDRLAVAGEVTIIDLHSFPLVPLPYELHTDGPRPEVCLGTDPFHTLPHLLRAAHESFDQFVIGEDSPSSGCYVPLKHHGVDDRVNALMIELRCDLYLDETFALVEPSIVPITEGLACLVDSADQVTVHTGQGVGQPDAVIVETQ